MKYYAAFKMNKLLLQTGIYSLETTLHIKCKLQKPKHTMIVSYRDLKPAKLSNVML